MAGSLVRYKPNRKSFGAFMLSRQVERPILYISTLLAFDAVRLTPLGSGPGPHMKTLYKVTKGTAVVGKYRNRRVVGIVSNTSDHAAAVEFGNSRSKAQRPLGRAAAMHGEARGKLE